MEQLVDVLGRQNKIIQEAENNKKQYETWASGLFTGLSGMKKEDRDEWEKEYHDKINGKDDIFKEEVFQDSMFKHFFEGKDDWRGDAYENRNNLTRDERNNLIAKAMSEHLISDDVSRAKYKKFGVSGIFNDTDDWLTKNANWRKHSMAYKADQYLANKQKSYLPEFVEKINDMSEDEQDKLLEILDSVSKENSAYYRRYNGTARLDESRNEKLMNAAKFMAAQKAAGESWALNDLNGIYQDKAAESQGFFGAVGNGFAGAGSIIVGELIHTIGMIYGTGKGLFSYDENSDESWWEQFQNSLIDNPISRYGTNISTTQSFVPSRQEHFLEEGISALPILKTRAQENQLLSLKTIAELVQQAGYTMEFAMEAAVGGTVVKSAIKGISKAASKNAAKNWAKQAAMGSATGVQEAITNGQKAISALNKSEKIAQLTVAGAIGGVEGSMNAMQTYDETIEKLKSQINQEYDSRVLQDINNDLQNNTTGVLYSLSNMGYDVSNLFPMLGVPDAETGVANAAYSQEQIQNMRDIIFSNPEIIESYKQRYADERNEALEKAEEFARQSMRNDFWFNSAVNGFVNSTLLKPFIINPARQAFNKGVNPVTSAIETVKTENGTWKAIAKKSTRKDLLKDYAGIFAGEALEEYIPNITSHMQNAMAENKMKQYLEFRNGDTPEGTAFDLDTWEAFTAGLEAANEQLVSKDAIREGLYGGIAAALMPKIMPKNRTKGKRGEKESALDYISRKSPLGVDIGAFGAIFNREGKQQTKANQVVADKINEFFNDDSFQEMLFGARAGMNWGEEYESAVRNNDEKAERDAAFGGLVNKIMILNNLKGTQYYEAVMNSMQRRSEFSNENLINNPESEEAKAVAILRGDKESDINNDVSDEDVLNKIVNEANDFLDTYKKIDEAQSEVEKIFGKNMDNDVKGAIVYNRLAIEDMKKRISQLEEEINSINGDIIKESGVSSGVSDKIKKLTVLRGNKVNYEKALTEARNELEKNQKAEEKLEDLIKEEEDENVKAELNSRLEIIKSIKNRLLDNIESIESAKENSIEKVVLSAKEIMDLSSDLRAKMLDDNNRKKYSDEQLIEIDKVLKIGTDKYSDFVSKINDQGRLTESLTESMREQLAIMADPTSLAMYSMNAKYRSHIAFLKNKHKDLLDLEKEGKIDEVEDRLDDIFQNADESERDAVRSLMKDSEMYKNWSEKNRYKNKIKGDAVHLLSNKSKQERDTFNATVDYYFRNGIDLNDAGAIDSKDFDAFLQSRKDKEGLEFLTRQQAMPLFKEIMTELNEREEQRKKEEKSISDEQHEEPNISGADPNPVFVDKDKKEIRPEGKSSKKDKEKEIPKKENKKKIIVSRNEEISVDMSQHRKEDDVLYKFYKQYDVDSFLEGEIRGGEKVYYIADPKFNNGKHIIMAVKVKDGGIQIGDEHYQPIGFVDNNNNTDFNNRLKRLSEEQSTDDSVVLLSDKGIPVESKIKRITKDPLKTTSLKNVPITVATENSIEDTTRKNEYKRGRENSDGKQSAEYKKQRRNFILKLSVVRNGEKLNSLIYDRGGHNFFVMAKHIYETPEILDAIRNGDIKKTNIFVQRGYNALVNTLKNDNFKLEDIFTALREIYDIENKLDFIGNKFYLKTGIGLEEIGDKLDSAEETAKNLLLNIPMVDKTVRWSLPFNNVEQAQLALENRDAKNEALIEWQDLYDNDIIIIGSEDEKLFSMPNSVIVENSDSNIDNNNNNNPSTNQSPADRIDDATETRDNKEIDITSSTSQIQQNVIDGIMSSKASKKDLEDRNPFGDSSAVYVNKNGYFIEINKDNRQYTHNNEEIARHMSANGYRMIENGDEPIYLPVENSSYYVRIPYIGVNADGNIMIVVSDENNDLIKTSANHINAIRSAFGNGIRIDVINKNGERFSKQKAVRSLNLENILEYVRKMNKSDVQNADVEEQIERKEEKKKETYFEKQKENIFGIPVNGLNSKRSKLSNQNRTGTIAEKTDTEHLTSEEEQNKKDCKH